MVCPPERLFFIVGLLVHGPAQSEGIQGEVKRPN